MNRLNVNVKIAMRLDRYLRRCYPSLTQGIIERLLRRKFITLNEQKASSSNRVFEGDIINIDDTLEEFLIFDKIVPITNISVITLAQKIFNDYKIYDHTEFLVISKPTKLATQGGSKIKLSICDAIKYYNYKNNVDFKLTHRLDKDTSGVMIIAKNHSAAVKITQGFKDKVIKKEYLAICQDSPKNQFGVVENFITKNQDKEKHAVTQYDTLYANTNYSVIKFMPITGRTHQLRIHAQLLGCSIVGDVKYGSSTSSSKGEMMLHAHKIEIPESLFNETITIKAPIPEYFCELLPEFFKKSSI